ncbi:Protein-tyrosine phosphatase, receptor/non-receptor type domain and Protein-tyrosine/Dual specificity phosphatase domain and Protein-tyrosine phosphatase, catalytic domain-containing protein [Strongyloides ratti]|uniref:Protein-tyrosine phosphatase, receptor/non-receptor type domain and Protein-tyrosine/Dual specificity phosphatase domain and Protein-tyrosine phosphatase, catalytic domain-containing protein n=1 Tax=Strongyloides ratti TaxID=34506 RepID=A0A090L3W6_STRRB|nr:Protein-tyrosine phosphatase, receptor/non-receptor type domain and Protein-tyrosine/Dual specificity phosphatase domain and Protein-tyrosine phosphatase, catalytic domain-containing protein [Strongyloides ratti]CEF62159.1 Protein-tyrosine phosphatase, receptor/non-receptor type domain and Protein-tyrosine/Dual specificity phosphatase domain and Protein-tyrosine phosphatase, catalytic domain-containing protein [Strongyloides ratti]
MPVSKDSTVLKNKNLHKRKSALVDDLKTCDDNEKKPKDPNKKSLENLKSMYNSVSKMKPSHGSGVPGKTNKISNDMNIKSQGTNRSEAVKINDQSATKPKKKGISKNVKCVVVDSKKVKKEFLKNEDEEYEGINEGTKDNLDIDSNIEQLPDMTKTYYITTDSKKDVRKKFCEQLLEIKNIKKVVANKEFKNPKYKPMDLPATAFAKNTNLNRYSDVKCIDKTRVKLNRNIPGLKGKKTSRNSSNEDNNKSSSNDNDYIHANYVKVPNSDFTYICCQGPLENTLEDHWLMCWQENVKVIVMLCEVIEDNEEKCHKYWPDLMTKKAYGGIIVVNEKEDTNKYVNVVIRTFRIQLGEKKRTIIQYHMRSWPDRLIPTGTPIICCIQREVQLVSGLNPIVVHCSAGIGRTGTFMGIHYLSERFKVSPGGSTNVMEALKELREQRLQSVQSTIQFGYLHICLLQYFCEENIFEHSDSVKEFISKSVDLVHEYALRLAKKNKEKEV